MRPDANRAQYANADLALPTDLPSVYDVMG